MSWQLCSSRQITTCTLDVSGNVNATWVFKGEECTLGQTLAGGTTPLPRASEGILELAKNKVRSHLFENWSLKRLPLLLELLEA